MIIGERFNLRASPPSFEGEGVVILRLFERVLRLFERGDALLKFLEGSGHDQSLASLCKVARHVEARLPRLPFLLGKGP